MNICITKQREKKSAYPNEKTKSMKRKNTKKCHAKYKEKDVYE